MTARADGEAPLEIDNDSQYTLVEVRLHEPADYLAAPNAIAAPLPTGDSVQLSALGTRYVTVFRERYQGGPLLALTMATPIDLEAGHRYRLVVYDESFRLFDEGPGDASDAGGCTCSASRP